MPIAKGIGAYHDKEGTTVGRLPYEVWWDLGIKWAKDGEGICFNDFLRELLKKKQTCGWKKEAAQPFGVKKKCTRQLQFRDLES